MRKALRLTAVLLVGALLTACTAAPKETAGIAAATLPPAAQPYGAPIGDAQLSYDAVADLYLPDPTGTRLIAQQEDVTLTLGRSPAESVVRALLAREDSASSRSLGGDVHLQLGGVNPIEYSCGVCTVSLASSALQLEREDFYTLCLAIASTLGAQGFTGVNVLVAGQAVGMDITSVLPLGTLSARPVSDLSAQWTQFESRRPAVGEDASQVPLNATATLYFPTAEGTGILAETRDLSFLGQTPQQLAATLTEALSAGAQVNAEAARMPDVSALLLYAPQIGDLGDGGKAVSLYFPADMESTLRAASIDPAAFFAALTYTYTTFIPGVTGVRFYFGGAQQTFVRSADYVTYPLDGGMATRHDFASFVMDCAELALVRDGMLTLASRPLPFLTSASPRALLLALAETPTVSEAAAGEGTLLPSDTGDADILGLAVVEDTLLVNFSSAFGERCGELGAREERLLAYQMVNTLCRSLKVRRVRFFFGSAPVDRLSGGIWWNGEFFADDTLFGMQ